MGLLVWRSEERRVGKECGCGGAVEHSSRRRHTRSKRDWSSDVCSSDLFGIVPEGVLGQAGDLAGVGDLEHGGVEEGLGVLIVAGIGGGFFGRAGGPAHLAQEDGLAGVEIGRASCRERVWVWGGGGTFKQKTAYEIET